MARPIAQDPYQLFDFRIEIAGKEVDAGFVSCTLPEIAIATVEYKTTLMRLPRKLTGPMTLSDVTLTRGVMRKNTDLYDWARKTQESDILKDLFSSPTLGPREDIWITHMHRSGARRAYLLRNAIPVTLKVSSDLDANSNDVGIEEFTIAFEDLEIREYD